MSHVGADGRVEPVPRMDGGKERGLIPSEGPHAMKVILDGMDITMNLSDRSLSSALHAVRSKVAEHGYAITGLVLDDRNLAGDIEADLGEKDVAAFGLLRVCCRKPTELASSLLAELGKHGRPLSEAANKAVELLESADEKQAFDMLAGVLELAGMFLETVQRVVILLKLDTDSLNFAETSYSEVTESGTELLRSALEGVENRDAVALCDFLKHELLPAIPMWEKFLDEFRHYIDAMQ